MTTNETERAAFEAAFPVPKYVKFSRAERYIGECSRDADLADDYNDKWKVWQARAALPTTGGEVVQLPRYNLVDGSGYMADWDDPMELDPDGEWCKYADVIASHRPEPAQPDSGEGWQPEPVTIITERPPCAHFANGKEA